MPIAIARPAILDAVPASLEDCAALDAWDGVSITDARAKSLSLARISGGEIPRNAADSRRVKARGGAHAARMCQTLPLRRARPPGNLRLRAIVLAGAALGTLAVTDDSPWAGPSPDVRTYVCVLDGVRRYGDRPCAPAERSLGTVAVPLPPRHEPVAAAAPAVAESARRAARSTARPATGPHPPARSASDRTVAARESARTAERCRRLTRDLERLDEDFRAGYGVEEGERLKRRRRELREDLRWYACR